MNANPAQDDRHHSESETVVHKVKRTCPSNAKKGAQKVPRKEDKIDEAFEMLRSVVAKEKPVEISDACSDYGKHVANKLRNYSERTKALVQYHFNNILFQADMGHFDINRNTGTTSFNQNYRKSPLTLPTGNLTMPIPTPSPQEITQSELSYTDLSSPLSEVNCQEQSASNETAGSFLTNWQI